MTRAIVTKHNEQGYDSITATTQENRDIYTVPSGGRNTIVGVKGNLTMSTYDTSSASGFCQIIIYRRPNGSDNAVVSLSSTGEICDQMQNVLWSWTHYLHESDRTSYDLPIDIKVQRKMFSGDSLQLAFVTSNANAYISLGYNFNTFTLEA